MLGRRLKDDGLTEVTVRVSKAGAKAVQAEADHDAMVRAKIERGRADIKAGRFKTEEEMDAVFDKILSKAPMGR